MATVAPPPGRPDRRGARSRRRRGRWATWRIRAIAVRRTAERRFPVLTELTARLLSVNLLDAATRLAAQIFLTAVPFMFVAATIAPDSVRTHILDSAHDLFGLNGSAQDQLQRLYDTHGADTETDRQTVGAIGAVVALLAATSTSRAMARVCERAWLLPRSSARVAAWRWFTWIVAWVAVLALQGPLREGLGAGPWLGVPLIFLADLAVWWWSQHLLLGARVPWLPLLPGAVLTSAAMTALSVTARIYLPLALNRSLATYGPLGSVFTLLSWLIAICVCLTFTITAGAVLATEPPLAQHLQWGTGARAAAAHAHGTGARGRRHPRTQGGPRRPRGRAR
ncbi:membrane protein [Actinacidiphila yanglinensis]|uniref:Membrane protein n=1 Tax=Actinacidiphila yanglinensis TaxID=310779 RepID=A0A1H6DAS8_9ACTN|nr:YhjD/YihY/BrkB family envelope integrity protein [Actinacidiphila yanglinensis]SEG82360.1 membrane protein [Actinacidiphila yanglinensis]